MLLGTDIESVTRFQHLLIKKPGMLKRLFTDYEYQYAMAKAAPAQALAGIWCAKEAVVKALGTIALIDIRDVEIKHTACGAPLVAPMSGYTITVSIAHTKTYATAVALAQQQTTNS
jgi:holo-[acyl-carrier protein] synthase